ncbi:indole acetimide hydrolase [Streptomyces humidus]|uniref:Indole acetimide hydrolase n=1 Tax=Streptomyces humidus TaxID=52259 RepID=A0A918GG14_9ACTN|nr:amidase family protein [Streptomyces humidus]GGS30540.1 indole acetimide hydrolase [Streptomyces humidus]
MQTALARLAAGDVTSAELTEACLARAAQTSDLGAFVTLDADRALRAARSADRCGPQGPLHGLPLAVKDNIHVAGLPNTAGSKALADFIPERDATVVSRLRAAGAVVLGKTNMHEFAFGATSARGPYGAARNPVDPARFAGGSSGGTATAIASGAAPAGLGTDTGGSVRVPAALTGIAGLRPTTGRYPDDGVTPLSWTRDTVGPMAPTVAGLVVLDGVLAADATPVIPPHPGEVVLAVPAHHFTELLHPRTAAVWEAGLDALAEAGVTLVPVRLPEVETAEDLIGFPVTLYEAARQLPRYLRETAGREPADCLPLVTAPDVRTALAEFVLDGAPGAVSDVRYEEALRSRERVLVDGYARIFRTADAVFFPTTPLPAGLIATEAEQVALHGSLRPTFRTYIRNTGPGSVAGLPGVTVPAALAGPGLPVGLALDGARHADRRLLGIALLVERLLTAAG